MGSNGLGNVKHIEACLAQAATEAFTITVIYPEWLL